MHTAWAAVGTCAACWGGSNVGLGVHRCDHAEGWYTSMVCYRLPTAFLKRACRALSGAMALLCSQNHVVRVVHVERYC